MQRSLCFLLATLLSLFTTIQVSAQVRPQERPLELQPGALRQPDARPLCQLDQFYNFKTKQCETAQPIVVYGAPPKPELRNLDRLESPGFGSVPRSNGDSPASISWRIASPETMRENEFLTRRESAVDFFQVCIFIGPSCDQNSILLLEFTGISASARSFALPRETDYSDFQGKHEVNVLVRACRSSRLAPNAGVLKAISLGPDCASSDVETVAWYLDPPGNTQVFRTGPFPATRPNGDMVSYFGRFFAWNWNRDATGYLFCHGYRPSRVRPQTCQDLQRGFETSSSVGEFALYVDDEDTPNYHLQPFSNENWVDGLGYFRVANCNRNPDDRLLQCGPFSDVVEYEYR